MHFEAVMRRAGRLDGLEPVEAADAVVGMDDEIAAARLDASVQHVAAALARLARRTSRSPRMSCSPIDGEPRRLEAGLERQHGQGRRRRRHRQRLGQARRRACVLADAVLGKELAKPLARALLQQATITRLPSPCSRSACVDHRIEDVDAFGSARSAAKVRPCRPPNDTTVRRGCSGCSNGSSAMTCAVGKRLSASPPR